jgi:hypothetical protein
MSHFNVLVIGDNVDEQLAPYYEGREDISEYERGEVSEEDKQRFRDYYINQGENSALTFEAMYKIHGESWNSNQWKKKEDDSWVEVSTYNPDSKWDWFLVGGRWRGFFRLKQGVEANLGEPGTFERLDIREGKPGPDYTGKADQATKGEIDFEAMRKEATDDAADTYDKAMKIFGDTPPNETWVSIRERYADIEEARRVYGAQSRVQAAQKDQEMFGLFHHEIDDFLCTREEYIERARNGAFSTYAFVKDGKWYGKGEMGWWGMSSGDQDQKEWNKQFNKMLDELSDDTLLTLVDCHI